jgi:hypothetical protein
MGNIQVIIRHKYKCCLSENIEEVETDEEENDRQIVKQLPAIEMSEPASEDSFATTIPCNFRK